jgi:hypothetical protein
MTGFRPPLWQNFVILFIILVVIVIGFRVTVPSIENRRVEHIVGNAGRFLALRLPPTPEGIQEQIIAYRIPDRPDAIGLVRTIAHQRSEDGLGTDLTGDDLNTFMQFYAAWCNNPPELREAAPDEPGFDLALCGTWRIPIDELPPELVTLIEAVPSPTCDDPFCGWRDEVME